jgi:iron-sulfur cluster repair protein YtfE (RIC family)
VLKNLRIARLLRISMDQEGLEAQRRRKRPVLIDILKQQHEELLQYIQQLGVLLVRGDEAGARAALSALILALRAHVSLEDRTLYPRLAQAAESRGEEKMLETAYHLSSNMHRIIESLQDFLSRHEASFHLERFRAGWSRLSAEFVERIESEEHILYPPYERYVLGIRASLLRRCSSLQAE